MIYQYRPVVTRFLIGYGFLISYDVIDLYIYGMGFAPQFRTKVARVRI